MRESFIFYRSFYEALKELDENTQLKIFRAITEFALCENEPELNGIEKAVFLLIKPQLEANNKRYANGKNGGKFGGLGGRPKKETSEENPKKPQKNPKETPNENVNVNKNENHKENEKDEIEILENPYVYSDVFDNDLQACFKVYRENCENLLPLSYERKHRETVKLLNDVFLQLDCDIGKFEQLCEKANDLRKIANKRIDFKMMLKNYIGILNDKYKISKTDNITNGLIYKE